MIRIAICDDQKILLEKIKVLILEYASKNQFEIQCDCFTTGEDLLSSSVVDEYKIVFLDVDMGDGIINGIEVGRLLKQKNAGLILVYVSNLIQYAPVGYELDAFRYILKENLQKDLFKCFDALKKKLFANCNSKLQLLIK